MRHTCATIALPEGINTKVVSDCRGHASARMMLAVCEHVLPGMQETATEKLDQTFLGGAGGICAEVGTLLAPFASPGEAGSWHK
ncbi:MAG: hypothetical protein GY725_00340 [bacterium]|nr:hypothetical protein [bacterium]